MKTSVIEVPDMLSVLTVDEVEERFEEVPGVESATVNYAAGKITVRYDDPTQGRRYHHLRAPTRPEVRG